MSIPFGNPKSVQLPEYVAPLAVSIMALATAFALAPEAMTHCVLQIFSHANFFFSGQAV